MVPKLFSSGKSFKNLAAYLCHDPDKAKTNERVRWTHTLNLASDHPATAVNEMLWTYRAAEDLKREAGGRTGGRPLDNPVKHLSLNWHPSQSPSREHMIETVESFLEHMRWDGRQALIVCHDDKHPHVHVMVNSVHPETGLALDTSFEKRRAQIWALAYERDHELVFCEERLKPVEERTPSPTRASWEKLRQYEREDDRAEQERLAKDVSNSGRADEKEMVSREWDMLKALQRDEREQFFIDGKEAYRAVRNAAYRQVRAEFREEWNDYYEARRAGLESEPLAALRADILERQSAALDIRRDVVCAALREERDQTYAALLQRHTEQRHELHALQRAGERSYDLLDASYPVQAPLSREPNGEVARQNLMADFREASIEIGSPTHELDKVSDRLEPERDHAPLNEHHRVRDPVDAMGGIGLGALGAIANIGERLFDGFLGGGEKPAPTRRVEPERAPSFGERADTLRAVSEQAKAQAREAEEARARSLWWEERRQRGRERD